MSITLVLPQKIQLDSLSMQCYRYQDAWIFLPQTLVFGWSVDGVKWEESRIDLHTYSGSHVLSPTDAQDIVRIACVVGASARFVRMEAVNPGPCPDWHDAASSPSWMFLDELVVHGR
jgi:hypothetical protein